jgi:ADP-heptose:LPS heptosyltransferase
MQWQLIQTLRQQRYDMVLNLADQWPSDYQQTDRRRDADRF